MTDEPKEQEISTKKKGLFDGLTDSQKKIFAVIGLGAIGGISLISSLGSTLTKARKSDPKYFDVGLEDGASLARKALLRATFYAVGGVGLLTFVVAKALDVHSLIEFRIKMQSIFKAHVPDIPRNPNPGRSDFKSIRELFEYLDEEDKNLKRKRLAEQADK